MSGCSRLRPIIAASGRWRLRRIQPDHWVERLPDNYGQTVPFEAGGFSFPQANAKAEPAQATPPAARPAEAACPSRRRLPSPAPHMIAGPCSCHLHRYDYSRRCRPGGKCLPAAGTARSGPPPRARQAEPDPSRLAVRQGADRRPARLARAIGRRQATRRARDDLRQRPGDATGSGTVAPRIVPVLLGPGGPCLV